MGIGVIGGVWVAMHYRAKAKPPKVRMVGPPAPAPSPRAGNWGGRAHSQQGSDKALAPDREVQQGDFGPNFLPPGQLRDLSIQALYEYRQVLGTDGQPPIPELVADFLAALRWYRIAVSPHFGDDNIEALLGDNPQALMSGFIGWYQKAQPSADRDKAIEILQFFYPQDTMTTVMPLRLARMILRTQLGMD